MGLWKKKQSDIPEGNLLIAVPNRDNIVDLVLAHAPSGIICGYRKTTEQMSLLSVLAFLKEKRGLNGSIIMVPMDDFPGYPGNPPFTAEDGRNMKLATRELERLLAIAHNCEQEALLAPLMESYLGRVYSLFAIPFYMLSYPSGVQTVRKETAYSVPDELAEAVANAVRATLQDANEEVFVSRQVQPVRKLITEWGEFRTQAEDALRDNTRYIRHIYDNQVVEAGEEAVPVFAFPFGISRDLHSAVMELEDYYEQLAAVKESRTLDIPGFNDLLSGIAPDAYCPQAWMMQPHDLGRMDTSIVDVVRASMRGDPLPVPKNLQGVRGKLNSIRRSIGTAVRGCSHFHGDEL